MSDLKKMCSFNDFEKTDIGKRLSEKISEIRRRTLDVTESQIGNVPNWQPVRRQLLKLFGDLERFITEELNNGGKYGN